MNNTNKNVLEGETQKAQAKYEEYVDAKQQELLQRERSLQQAIDCAKKDFTALRDIHQVSWFIATLYNIRYEEAYRAINGDKYWNVRS